MTIIDILYEEIPIFKRHYNECNSKEKKLMLTELKKYKHYFEDNNFDNWLIKIIGKSAYYQYFKKEIVSIYKKVFKNSDTNVKYNIKRALYSNSNITEHLKDNLWDFIINWK